ncbi:MAG: hypothetical protein P4M11_01460 [Candidatus Pacebacteria bacterium]|nr:hypothetical protein [Candidatus Paceibacterota bacterium]
MLTAYSGMKCSISPIMQDNLIAELSLSSSDGFSPSYQNLARAILIRKNRRGGFLPQPIPADILKEAISNSPLLPDGLVLTEVSAIASPDGKSTLAELTAGNMKRVYSIPAFRREMSKWITPTGSPKRTGLPGYTLNQPVLMSWILPTIIRFVNMGPVLAKLNYGALATSSAIVGFGNTESPLGWVSTGFQASHTALTLVAHELNYSVFVAAIEYDDTRKKANDVFGLHYPLQFLFAAGKLPGEVDWKTPRIPIEKKSL